jgi:soluble lytic murein transglycosylase-like protein
MRLALAVLLAEVLMTGCAGFREAAPPPAPLDLALRNGPAIEPELACLSHPRIDVWERRLRSAAWRPTVRDDAARGARYLPRLRQVVVESGLPPSLALLPAVESGFRPDARGPLDELGLWQLRVDTARRFGLVVDERADERLYPEPSTRAAARYLRFLHTRYGDWPLALAAYNAGEGCVDRALQRRPHASFWELVDSGKLPRKSRDYVPRFLALVRIQQTARRCAPLSPLLASSGSLG